jgi:hypothetical protein
MEGKALGIGLTTAPIHVAPGAGTIIGSKHSIYASQECRKWAGKHPPKGVKKRFFARLN